MATHLSKESISRAIDHIAKFGDTDVFPHLIEIIFLRDMKENVVNEITALDLDSFTPLQSIETITPKSRYGFRIVHQLHMLETLLYTSAVIEIAADLDKTKRPLDEPGPFSYRFSPDGDSSLFIKDHTYRDWLSWQEERITTNKYSQIVCTDIADFYQRIYLHRIENCLDAATSKKGIKRFIEKLIKQVRSRQSHGIPVGGTASRLIAEAVLADADNSLAGQEIEFTRFVDDYTIFVKDDQSPYTILAFFAEQLAANEGLSLNAQKTKLFEVDEFELNLAVRTGDAFDDAEKKAIAALTHSIYFDESISEDDLAKLRNINLVGMLKKELDEELWDFGKIKAIFRALRLAPDPESVSLLEEQFEKFLPFMKDFTLYLEALKKAHADVKLDGLQAKVLGALRIGAAASVTAIRVWLLELFVRGTLLISTKQIGELTKSESLDNRQIYLIRGQKGDVNFFRSHKARFDEKNQFEKLAFLLGATCLPKDEFETWINAIKPNMVRPLDKLFCDWVKGKRGRLEEVVRERSELAKE